MSTVCFAIAGWAAWADGRALHQADDSSPHPVPMLLRRRVTPLGTQALKTAHEAGDIGQARYVFSSRHGEFGRTARLLHKILEENEASPAEFSMTVHNALTGVLSIAAKNTSAHTAIAAGRDSFCFGLLEAATQLAEAPESPVLLLYCDEPLPDDYQDFNDQDEETVVAALLLTAPSAAAPRYTLERAPVPTSPPPAATAQATAVVEFLLSGATGRVVGGERCAWHLSHAA